MNEPNTTYLLLATLVMFLVNFTLRGFVFAALGGTAKPPRVILYIGYLISPAIIAALIVYCLRETVFTTSPYGIPELAATAVCILLHLWKRNPLASIVAGTVLYMVLLACG